MVRHQFFSCYNDTTAYLPEVVYSRHPRKCNEPSTEAEADDDGKRGKESEREHTTKDKLNWNDLPPVKLTR